ncbi:MAG: cellulase family glycosylhydrolase [Verrucomicrobiota bacterium JB024]|nr:cellulase family glycosylhydrolase [Verrucomicrobiota bacterium JB024]
MIHLNRIIYSALAFLAIGLIPLHASRTYNFPLNQIGDDGLAASWRDNSSWADVDVEYQADQVFEELKAQRVTVSAVRQGRVQMFGPSFSVEEGKIYSVSIRLRSLGAPASVLFLIREPGPPYRDKVAEHRFEATTEWKTQSFFFEAKKNVENYMLLLAFPSPCDVVIERIDILEESPEEFTDRMAHAHTGDGLFRHPNPGFLLGKTGYTTTAVIDRQRQYPLQIGKQYALNPPAWEIRTETDADATAVVELGDYNTVFMTTLADLLPGRPLTVLARVRLTEGSLPVTLSFFSPSWSDAPAELFTVGEEWTVLKLTGTPPMDDGIQARVDLTVQGESVPGSELEIDYLILTNEPDEAEAALAEASPVAFAAEPDKEMTFYVVGEDPVVTLFRAGGTGETVSWKLVDAEGHEFRSGTWTMAGDGPINGDSTYTFKDLPVGWWQLQWDAPWAQFPTGVVNFAVVPPMERIGGSASPFGIHVEGCEYGLEKMNYMGIQWLRTQNPLWTKWSAVQPERDTWVYPDEYIDLFINAGKDILLDLDRTPRWAARNPDNFRLTTDFMDYRADLPGDWPAWEEYVRRMVERYKDRVHYWEIWNEPDIPFLRPPEGMTNAEAFLQLLEHSTPVIRSIDPTAKVVISPAYYLKKRGDPNGYQEDFTERLIEAGGMQYADVYAVHFYFAPGQRVFDHPEKYEDKLDKVLDAMVEAGCSDPQIWNSEWGIINFTIPTHPVNLPSTNGLSPVQAARDLVVWSGGMLAAGLEKLFWYDGQDNYYLHFHVTKSLFDYKQPRPVAVAYAVLTKQLDGLAFVDEEPVEGESGRVLVFESEDGSRQVRLAYAFPGESFTLPSEGVAATTDFLGQPQTASDGGYTIGENPVYLETGL